MYTCEWCENEIENPQDGLIVKIQSPNQKVFERSIMVHKGECDESACGHYQNQGKNTNASLGLEMLINLNWVEEYYTTGKSPW